MARDLIPPPSPAGRPDAATGRRNLIELPPEPPRSPAEPRDGRAEPRAVAVPQPLRLPARRARGRRSSPRRWSASSSSAPTRAPLRDERLAPNWSEWQPSDRHGRPARARSPSTSAPSTAHGRQAAGRRSRRAPLEDDGVVLRVRARAITSTLVDGARRALRDGRARAAWVDQGRQAVAERLLLHPPRGARARALHVPLPAGRREVGHRCLPPPSERRPRRPRKRPRGRAHTARPARGQAASRDRTRCPLDGARSSTARATSGSSCRCRCRPRCPARAPSPASFSAAELHKIDGADAWNMFTWSHPATRRDRS